MNTCKYFKHLFFLSALAMAACTSEEEPILTADANQAIAFSTYIQQGSRSVDATDKTAFETGDVIGLYACQTTGNYSGEFTANFMNEVQVTKGADGSWTYAPLKAWPTDANEHLSFIAFYPYLAGVGTFASELQYSFTVNDDITQQIDPLWCTVKDAHVNDRNGTAINGQTSDEYTPVSGAIPLKFRHLLSKIVVNVKLAEAYEGTTATLRSLVLKDVCKKGWFEPSGDLASGTWTLQKTSSNWTSYTIHASTAAALTLSNSSQKLGQLFMIPQDVYVNSNYTNQYNTCFEITYEHTLAGGGTREITKAISLPNSWEMDKVYNYTISLTLDVNDISITADVLNRSEEVNNSANNTPAQAVDLGLPSGTKWASHDYGIESESDMSPIFTASKGMEIVKNWGSNWTIPTSTQWQELKNNCTRTEETINGIEGYKFTASNGNSIFFSKKNGDYYMYYDSSSNGYSLLGNNTSSGSNFPIRPVTQ